MPFSYFSKIHKGISWSELNDNRKLQISNKCKELEYLELTTIVVDQSEFDTICKDVSCARNSYREYVHESIATLDGRWQCIIIKSQSEEKKIILYTAGRIYPLYAAVCE